ncbi:hypothetical protein GCM10008967_23960 [Bacillus carboniphilus]|uniref:DUF393 domain-containing protein n=1 Tax=Bacillus carboniphilus TaxID=86663 RepID=A0ABN0WD04_9BACI
MSIEKFALYDAQCLLCQKSKSAIQKIDTLNRFTWVSLQEYEKREDAIPFKPVELRRELHLVIQKGEKVKVLKGFLAIRYMFLFMPLTFFLGVLAYFPGVTLIGNPLYKWVAKRRHNLLKHKCDSDQCSL